MISINVIGAGNVATHLIRAFSQAEGIAVRQVFSRRAGTLPVPAATELVHDLSRLQPADVTIISVSDDAVSEVSAALPLSGGLVIHTSGSLPMDALDAKHRRGVFYPLQTFSKEKDVDFSQVPLCLEASEPDDLVLLKNLASQISGSVREIGSRQRKALHVAAVFVSNFTNHLYWNGEQLCREHGVDFDILKPLIRETADKVMTLAPADAQTGPARRHDQKTLAAHRDLLGDSPRGKLYELLTQSIQHGQL